MQKLFSSLLSSAVRSAKLSTSSHPVTDLSSPNQDESSVFYSGADSTPAAAASSGTGTADLPDMYSDLYNDLHNKLNWLTVSDHYNQVVLEN